MIDPPGVEAWRPWTPREVADLLVGVTAPWCVAGGWALDLWLGRETRPHEDLEIELVLRFKTKAARANDELDFAAALPRLDASARSQLRRWLEQLHPAHASISRL